MLPRLALPPSLAVLALIALVFAAPGLLGHDPWKTYDVISIEIVHRMQLSGDWLVPQVAESRWLADPPLYYWTGLAFAKAFAGLLGFHQAVRLASGAFVLAALALAYVAARDFAPQAERRATAAAAPLFIIGAIGLIVHAHEALPDLAGMAAACGAFAALAHATRRPLVMGTAFGAALGIAFLASGFVVPAALGVAAIAALLACDEWRTRRGAAFLGVSALVTLALASSWPLALWLRSPKLLAEWWSLTTDLQGAFFANLDYFLVAASWFAWPAWPVAGWALWSQRRRWREPRLVLPLATALATLVGISLAGPPQEVNTLGLVAPLALLAAGGVPRLRRGAANALDWFGVMTFTFVGALIWLGYVATMTPLLPTIAHNFAKLAPGFAAHFAPLPFVAALAVTFAWLYVAFFTAPSQTRGVTRWAAGIALLWSTLSFLLLPWADHVKSYRSVALQIRAHLPAGAGCIAREHLGISQRAALSYHAGIVTREFDPFAPATCRLLLVQSTPEEEPDVPSPSWRRIADVGRPGDKAERLRLYYHQKR
jgi:4-amino-4-deoxy-L-arabinose transferase-like glycosyltransferase